MVRNTGNYSRPGGCRLADTGKCKDVSRPIFFMIIQPARGAITGMRGRGWRCYPICRDPEAPIGRGADTRTYGLICHDTPGLPGTGHRGEIGTRDGISGTPTGWHRIQQHPVDARQHRKFERPGCQIIRLVPVERWTVSIVAITGRGMRLRFVESFTWRASQNHTAAAMCSRVCVHLGN